MNVKKSFNLHIQKKMTKEVTEMKNEYFENEWMVNNNHHKIKSQEYHIPVYTDHEIRMKALRKRAKREQIKANREAMYISFMMIVGMPIFIISGYLGIKFVWLYSFAVRGF